MEILKFLKETYIDNWKPVLMYLIRWQTSTPIFLILGMLMLNFPYWEIIVISNIMGGIIYFPVDKWIMKRNKK